MYSAYPKELCKCYVDHAMQEFAGKWVEIDTATLIPDQVIKKVASVCVGDHFVNLRKSLSINRLPVPYLVSRPYSILD